MGKLPWAMGHIVWNAAAFGDIAEQNVVRSNKGQEYLT
jgi:hypothetical protein